DRGCGQRGLELCGESCGFGIVRCDEENLVCHWPCSMLVSPFLPASMTEKGTLLDTASQWARKDGSKRKSGGAVEIGLPLAERGQRIHPGAVDEGLAGRGGVFRL